MAAEEEDIDNKDGDVTQAHKEKGQKSNPLTKLQSAEPKHIDEEHPIVEDILSEAPSWGFDWKETMGYCNDETLTQTLENTIQYFPNHIKSEMHAYPT
eukprot:5547398-Ditylum_brightwellii.AAC.1